MVESEIVLYPSDGRAHLQRRAYDGIVWLTQTQMRVCTEDRVKTCSRRSPARVLKDGEVTDEIINSELII